MNEIDNTAFEQKNSLTLDDISQEVSLLRPKMVEAFVPANGEEQKRLFMDGSIRNPNHVYENLHDFDHESAIARAWQLNELLQGVSIDDPLELMAHADDIRQVALNHELLQAARDTHSSDEETARSAAARFMELNEKLYGAPVEETYRSLASDTMRKLQAKNLSQGMESIRSELAALLPTSDTQTERFSPSTDTIQDMQQLAEYLYGGMLRHIPKDQDSFTPQQIAEIFTEIIKAEFGDAAEGWRVVLVKATSISVAAGSKLIKIPEDRKPASYEELRGLVAHEIGVHVLSSVTGSETNLTLLKTGLSGYYDSEEGLGKVMEQAVKGKYEESGTPSYLAAGLMHFDNKDFRDTYEVMWRIKYLEDSAEGEDISEEKMNAAKDSMYKTIFRLTRGTDELPWFKDLAYYNGASKMWKYCESASRGPEEFMFLLMGKSDMTNATHRRIMFETRST